MEQDPAQSLNLALVRKFEAELDLRAARIKELSQRVKDLEQRPSDLLKAI
jgi:hypothetical protein